MDELTAFAPMPRAVEASFDQPSRKRVLLITYPFPPVGGAGVQRVTKFVKYLPEHGWDVSVLTVANPSVPLHDDSLAKDIPSETIVCKARSWEPGYSIKASVAASQPVGKQTRSGPKKRIIDMVRRLGSLVLQPDPQILWMPEAVSEGKRFLKRIRHDIIVASGPPFSTFLLARALSRFSNLPLVLDYRDEWTISNEYWENKRLDRLSRRIQSRMQQKVIRSAQGLVATTRSSAVSLSELNRRCAGQSRITWIYNGFDPDDFVTPCPKRRSDRSKFRLSYTGTLWNLTSVAPLVDAVKRLARDEPELAAGLELVFVGRRIGSQPALLAQLHGLPCQLIEYPYLEHSEAVAFMRESEALCLLLSDLPGAGRVVPAKLFEYMATGRPILTIAPPGETLELLGGYPGAQFFPSDVDGIATWLKCAIREHQNGSTHSSAELGVCAFTRVNQAGQLADFMNSILLSNAHTKALGSQ